MAEYRYELRITPPDDSDFMEIEVYRHGKNIGSAVDPMMPALERAMEIVRADLEGEL